MTRGAVQPSPSPPILLVDDDAAALLPMTMTMKMAGYADVQTCSNGGEALAAIKNHGCGCAVLDIILTGESGVELLGRIKEHDPEIPVIMATGVGEIDTAVRCMRLGAYDYIVKPIEGDRLVTSVRNALTTREWRRDYERLAERLLSDGLAHPGIFSAFTTRNPRMLGIFKYIEAVGPTSHPVLITGETGTGKELAARAIHAASGRQGAFVAVNAAGLDDATLSDTLFGHRKGSFTGADTARAGLVEAAAGGTLFLDEIGDMNVQSQVKLLRLLQHHEYYQLGDDVPKRSSARVITATCKDPRSLNDPESFRRDLFFRLRTHHIHCPPLRERKDDLVLLTEAFLEKAAAEQHKRKPTVPPELYTLLGAYHFPGNIRELEAMVYDAVSVHESRVLSLRSFRDRLGLSALSALPGSNAEAKVTFHHELPTLREIEDVLVREAFSRANGNQSVAAGLLGITRQSLSYRLKKNG